VSAVLGDFRLAGMSVSSFLFSIPSPFNFNDPSLFASLNSDCWYHRVILILHAIKR
jgi:hypothetical protein